MRNVLFVTCALVLFGCGGGKSEAKMDAKPVEGAQRAETLNPDDIFGSYLEEHSGVADGAAVDMEQCLYVAADQDAQHMKFAVSLLQDEMKRCVVSGVATLDAEASDEFEQVWIFRSGEECMLRLGYGSSQLTVNDVGGGCTALFCDEGAQIDQIAFSESKRVAGDRCAKR